MAPVVADWAQAALGETAIRQTIASRAVKRVDRAMRARLPDVCELRCIPWIS
jgi:hypothetical protein